MGGRTFKKIVKYFFSFILFFQVYHYMRRTLKNYLKICNSFLDLS